MAATAPLRGSAVEADDWSDFSESQHDLTYATWEFGTFESSCSAHSKDAAIAGARHAKCDPAELFGSLASGLFEDTSEERLRSYCPDGSQHRIASQTHLADLVKDNQTWCCLARSTGNARPVDWSKCRAREMQLATLQLSESQVVLTQNFDVSDDEELVRAFDVHCIVTSKARNDDDDIIATAEEVISEIDNILRMQESMMTVTTDDGYITECDMVSSAGSDCLYFREMPGVMQASLGHEDRLRQLSCLRLNELLDDVQSAVEERSRALTRELMLRDELEYELELKNQFITLCHNVMKKQKSGRGRGEASAVPAAAARKGSVEAFAAVAAGRTGSPGHASAANAAAAAAADASPRVLKKVASSKNRDRAAPSPSSTYHIPYEPRNGPPDADLLAIYIKILKAMHSDSPTVPALLTDYILKVVCPT